MSASLNFLLQLFVSSAKLKLIQNSKFTFITNSSSNISILPATVILSDSLTSKACKPSNVLEYYNWFFSSSFFVGSMLPLKFHFLYEFIRSCLPICKELYYCKYAILWQQNMYLFKKNSFFFILNCNSYIYIYANMCCYDNFQWLGKKIWEKIRMIFTFKNSLVFNV